VLKYNISGGRSLHYSTKSTKSSKEMEKWKESRRAGVRKLKRKACRYCKIIINFKVLYKKRYWQIKAKMRR